MKTIFEGIKSTLFIVGKSIRQHIFSTSITVFSTALAAGLLMAVFSIQAQSKDVFTGGATGFDAVLGARGSQSQLILNSIFHLDTSPGNIPWNLYLAMKKDPRVETAIPYAVGDNYFGFRIVGTTLELFNSGKNNFQLETGGRMFDPEKREALIGSFAAQKTRLKIGDIINPYHGLIYNEKMKHDEQFAVVGILKPTNTPSDRVIWISIEGFYRMAGHVLRGNGTEYKAEAGKEIPDDNKEVSAVMLKLKGPQFGFALSQTINRQGKIATLAWPIGNVIADLFDKMGWMSRILLMVAFLVVLVAGASIMASIYNSINERKRDFAILRSLGAHKTLLFSCVVTESGMIALAGALIGYGIYISILLLAAVIVRDQTGVVLKIFYFHPVLVWGPVGIGIVGAIAGTMPAIKAYKTDVASNLVPQS